MLIRAIIVFLALFASTFQIAAQNLSSDPVTVKEYEIYDFILKEWFRFKKEQPLTVSALTDSPSRGYEPSKVGRQWLKGVDKQLVGKFIVVNEERFQLSNRFSSTRTIVLVTDEDLIPIMRQERADGGAAYRKAFFERFGTETQVTFSRVAFSADEALLCVGYSCGPTCGEGNYVLLRRSDSGWKVVKKIFAWIA